MGDQFADEGDVISFVDKSNLRPVGSGRIRSIDKSDLKAYIIETDFDLGGVADPTNIALENISRGADVTIRNCTVRYNRARSLLLSTYGDVLVEDCDFASQMSGICVSGDANFWYESGRTKNIVIRNNKFTDLAIGANGPAGHPPDRSRDPDQDKGQRLPLPQQRDFCRQHRGNL